VTLLWRDTLQYAFASAPLFFRKLFLEENRETSKILDFPFDKDFAEPQTTLHRPNFLSTHVSLRGPTQCARRTLPTLLSSVRAAPSLRSRDYVVEEMSQPPEDPGGDAGGDAACRFCFEGSDDENAGTLVEPCRCSGSLKYVHLKCLQRWQSQQLLSAASREAGGTREKGRWRGGEGDEKRRGSLLQTRQTPFFAFAVGYF
jgi:hypothetical protein